MRPFSRRSLSLLVTTLMSSTALFGTLTAPPIYNPGDPIPSGSFASTGIFGPLFNAGSSTPLSGPAYTLSGQGTPELYFQIPSTPPNNFRFDGVIQTAPIPLGLPFLLGYVTYTNGNWFVASYTADLTIRTTGTSLSPQYTQTYNGKVQLDVTANSGTPEQMADIFYFVSDTSLGSLRVFEGQGGRVEVWGYFGSLNLDSFGDVVSSPGSAFVYPDLTTLPANFVATNTGNGTVLPGAPVATPEPASMVLCLFGGGLLAYRRMRQKVSADC